MWDIVWVSPQGHRSVSVSRHFLEAPQCPCLVRKQFSRDHCCRERSKPGCRIVGSHTRWELTTWADFQLCLHQRLMSTGYKSSHNSFLDVSRSNGGLRISGWIGQLSCLTIFSTSLSVAAFLRRAGGSMCGIAVWDVYNKWLVYVFWCVCYFRLEHSFRQSFLHISTLVTRLLRFMFIFRIAVNSFFITMVQSISYKLFKLV